MSDFLSYDNPILVVDDFCDGEGTFLAIHKWFNEKPRNYSRNLFITHRFKKKELSELQMFTIEFI